jgi:hypothetical protein
MVDDAALVFGHCLPIYLKHLTSSNLLSHEDKKPLLVRIENYKWCEKQ